MKNSMIKFKPLSLRMNFLYLLIPAAILHITHYYLIPGYTESSGAIYFKVYLVGYVLTMGMFFAAALIAYNREGLPFTWDTFKVRYRLLKMNRSDWLWTLAIIIFALATYFGLGFSGKWVSDVPFLAPREAWPQEFGPGGTNNLTPGEFMEMPLKGQWWVIAVYFIGWFFNIFGEELWFRGYLLPRQELVFGKFAWIVNGLMFTLNHLWQPWILISILPSSLLLAYIVQSRRNTWISIIQHGIMNISLLFMLIGWVIG